MINQTDLKYFLEVAKTLHLTRASERLGISQPALSHCLKRIEFETEVSLFVRSKKGVTLTKAGERLAESAKDLIQRWEQVLLKAQSEVHEVAGTIRVGCHSAVAQYTLPVFLPSFLKDFPEISLELSHGLSRHMVEEVLSDKVDVAIAVNPSSHLDLIIKEVLKDTVGLWHSRDCKNRDVLILEPSLLQTQDLLRQLNKANFKFSRFIESPSLEVIAQLVASGAGYGILPERVAKAFGGSGMVKTSQSPEYHDKICLVYKREFAKTERGKAFKESFIKSHR